MNGLIDTYPRSGAPREAVHGEAGERKTDSELGRVSNTNDYTWRFEWAAVLLTVFGRGSWESPVINQCFLH